MKSEGDNNQTTPVSPQTSGYSREDVGKFAEFFSILIDIDRRLRKEQANETRDK